MFFLFRELTVGEQNITVQLRAGKASYTALTVSFTV